MKRLTNSANCTKMKQIETIRVEKSKKMLNYEAVLKKRTNFANLKY